MFLYIAIKAFCRLGGLQNAINTIENIEAPAVRYNFDLEGYMFQADEIEVEIKLHHEEGNVSGAQVRGVIIRD